VSTIEFEKRFNIKCRDCGFYFMGASDRNSAHELAADHLREVASAEGHEVEITEIELAREEG
jgi:hypothetical protein